MQQAIPLLTLTVVAAAQLTARRFVTHAGAVGTAGAAALGVARADGAIGTQVPVDVLGTAIVEAGEPLAAGAFIKVGANGKALTYASAGAICVGQLAPGESAAGDGSFVEVLLLTSRPVQL